MAKGCGGQVQGIPRIGWMHGMKTAFGRRVMTLEAAHNACKIGVGVPW